MMRFSSFFGCFLSQFFDVFGAPAREHLSFFLRVHGYVMTTWKSKVYLTPIHASALLATRANSKNACGCKAISNSVGITWPIPKIRVLQCFRGEKHAPTEKANTRLILHEWRRATQINVLSPSLCVSKQALGPPPRGRGRQEPERDLLTAAVRPEKTRAAPDPHAPPPRRTGAAATGGPAVGRACGDAVDAASMARLRSKPKE
jgi:hypothetical protein